jgi:hypothetical protein
MAKRRNCSVKTLKYWGVYLYFIFQDDEAAMDFVTATANIRAHIFGIPVKSRFDIKCK